MGTVHISLWYFRTAARDAWPDGESSDGSNCFNRKTNAANVTDRTPIDSHRAFLMNNREFYEAQRAALNWAPALVI
jgi:hypothetical protein